MRPKKHFARSPSGSPSTKKCSEQSAFGDTYQFSLLHYNTAFSFLQAFSFTKIKKAKKRHKIIVNYSVQIAQSKAYFACVFPFLPFFHGYLFIFRLRFCIRGEGGES